MVNENERSAAISRANARERKLPFRKLARLMCQRSLVWQASPTQFGCSAVRCSSVTPTQAKAKAINASRTTTKNANIALYLNVAPRMCALSAESASGRRFYCAE
jgi:hypothetical protein